MVNNVLYSSKKDEWPTPQWLYDLLNEEFHFVLDAAATKENTKCWLYCDKEIDGLEQDWSGTTWLNPPYTRRQIGKWMIKAAGSGVTSVVLVPSRTGTIWWHEGVMPYASEIRFIKGRLNFDGGKWFAPFDSVIVIYRPGCSCLKVGRTISAKEQSYIDGGGKAIIECP